MHANCRIWGGYEGVPSGTDDDDMRIKLGTLRSLELLYYISNKTTVTAVVPQSIYGVAYIIS